MQVKASVSSGYRWRLAAIAVMGLGWGAWCIADGFWRYPAHNEHVEAYKQFELDHPDDWRQKWDAEAKSRGWSVKEPGEEKSNWDIYTQHIMALVTLPIGVIFGVSFIRSGSRWIASDGATLTTSWGQAASFDSITSINKDRWQTKGIAVVQHNSSGAESRLILDDWKYEREPITTMVEQIDRHLGNDESPEEVSAGSDEASDEADSTA